MFLVGVVVQGYVSRLWMELASLVLGGYMAAGVLPGLSNLLLPEGRRQKYHLTVAAAVFATLLLSASWTVVAALSWILAALIPPISWGTHHWQYAGLRGETLLLVCLPVPWLFLLGPIRQRVPIVRTTILAVAAFLSLVEIFFRNFDSHHSPMLLPVLLVCGWALLSAALWITYRRWDLVGQRPIEEA